MSRSKYIKYVQYGYLYGSSIERLRSQTKLSNRRFRVTIKKLNKLGIYIS